MAEEKSSSTNLPAGKAGATEDKKEKEVGKVIHYYTNLGVAIIKLKDGLSVRDGIHVKGHTSDFTQKVESMQSEHKSIEKAKKGETIGLKVKEHVRESDVVYKVKE
jgi:translation elongation factor EF-1alpha